MSPGSSTHRRRLGAGTALIVVGLTVVLVSALSVGSAGAAPVPNLVDGNPKCADIDGGAGWSSTSQITASGSYSASDNSFSVDVTYQLPLSFSVTSGEVNAVIVKGGPNANVYFYAPPLAAPGSDSGLTTPTNPSNDEPYGLSHVEFCGGETTTTTTTTTTSTTMPDETTTTTGETTTTAPEETTTSTDVVVTTQVTPTSVSPSSVVVQTTAVTPTSAVATTAATLPATGGSNGPLALIGIGLFLSGVGLVALERRRGLGAV